MVLSEKVIRRCTFGLKDLGIAFGGYLFIFPPLVCRSSDKMSVFYASRSFGFRLFLTAL